MSIEYNQQIVETTVSLNVDITFITSTFSVMLIKIFINFGPRVYLRVSLVIALVRGPSVSL